MPSHRPRSGRLSSSGDEATATRVGYPENANEEQTLRRTLLALAALIAVLAAPALAQEDGSDLQTCGYLCSDDGTPLMTATDTPPETGLVTKIFIGAFSEACGWAIGGGPNMIGPEVYDLTYRPSWEAASEPERPLKLYRFFCDAGAYNERHIYYTWTSDEGVRPVSFALPTYEIAYEGGDYEAPLEALEWTGMTARHELVNSAFDPQTQTIGEWSCWRGLCDASGRGLWVLRDGDFSLVSYDIDPTYDGNVNLFRVADFSSAKAVDTSTPLPFEPPAFEDEELEGE